MQICRSKDHTELATRAIVGNGSPTSGIDPQQTLKFDSEKATRAGKARDSCEPFPKRNWPTQTLSDVQGGRVGGYHADADEAVDGAGDAGRAGFVDVAGVHEGTTGALEHGRKARDTGTGQREHAETHSSSQCEGVREQATVVVVAAVAMLAGAAFFRSQQSQEVDDCPWTWGPSRGPCSPSASAPSSRLPGLAATPADLRRHCTLRSLFTRVPDPT